MSILRIFGIGADRILAKDCHVPGVVTGVEISYVYVVKKPVRLGINEHNTLFSHYIHFTYFVDGTPYRGKLFVSLRYRCPQKGETIEVYYDPEKPQNYACYAFGPGVTPIGW